MLHQFATRVAHACAKLDAIGALKDSSKFQILVSVMTNLTFSSHSFHLLT